MATISHKNLTGNQLHEPKGADTATADKVYVSNGSGSGTWQKITSSQLTGSGNSFGAQLMQVRYEVPSGVGPGSAVAGAWRTRELNTVVTNEISGASLASNQITLPAGTYFIDAGAQFTSCGPTKTRIRNVTDSSTIISGLSNSLGTTVAVVANMTVSGRFTLSGTKTIELQFYVATGGPVLGSAVSAGETEVYVDIKIWKIA